MSFSKDLGRFRVRTETAADRIVRGLTIELFAGVVRDTPVDTGRARGNWSTTVGQVPAGARERLDQSGGAAIAEVVAETPEKVGNKVYLTNNLPYIMPLEEGYSKQAPAGMVRRNFLRVRQILSIVTARHRV
ncbi:MAG: hypothetical protein WA154_10860 [Moraxellaceae bacterium]